jgi:hypothetical protein
MTIPFVFRSVARWGLVGLYSLLTVGASVATLVEGSGPAWPAALMMAAAVTLVVLNIVPIRHGAAWAVLPLALLLALAVINGLAMDGVHPLHIAARTVVSALIVLTMAVPAARALETDPTAG